MTRPDSPCVGVCTTLYDEVCKGCGRSYIEVAQWNAMTRAEQEPQCPKCKAAVLYECVACSSNNYPPQRKPLIDEEIMNIVDAQRAKVSMDEARLGYRVARAIEAAHGIKETP